MYNFFFKTLKKNMKEKLYDKGIVETKIVI